MPDEPIVAADSAPREPRTRPRRREACRSAIAYISDSSAVYPKMCTADRPRACVIAASRRPGEVSVSGSGRRRQASRPRRARSFAEATKENGVVPPRRPVDAGQAHAEMEGPRCRSRPRRREARRRAYQCLLEAVDHRAERELPRAERLDHQLLLPPVDPGRGERDLPRQDPGAAGVFSAYSSQRDHRSSRPRTTSKNASWIAFVTGPGAPTSWSSTDLTGVTSAAVPHRRPRRPVEFPSGSARARAPRSRARAIRSPFARDPGGSNREVGGGADLVLEMKCFSPEPSRDASVAVRGSPVRRPRCLDDWIMIQ